MKKLIIFLLLTSNAWANPTLRPVPRIKKIRPTMHIGQHTGNSQYTKVKVVELGLKMSNSSVTLRIEGRKTGNPNERYSCFLYFPFNSKDYALSLMETIRNDKAPQKTIINCTNMSANSHKTVSIDFRKGTSNARFFIDRKM